MSQKIPSKKIVSKPQSLPNRELQSEKVIKGETPTTGRAKHVAAKMKKSANSVKHSLLSRKISKISL